MKFFMLILLVLALIWLWRTKRPGASVPHKKAPTDHAPLVMVACAHCAVHLPKGDAIQGEKGLYCSEEHRRVSEG
jgi:uncharacterized protein